MKAANALVLAGEESGASMRWHPISDGKLLMSISTEGVAIENQMDRGTVLLIRDYLTEWLGSVTS